MDAPGAFTWPDGKRVAASLTFDDARQSQLDAGLPILDRHGVKATFYVSIPRAAAQADAWRAAVATGHELGNHSLRHSCSANFLWQARHVLEDYTLETMETELLEANRQLTEWFGVTPQTFAYPCGQDFVGRGIGRQSYVPVVARNFLAGRGFRDEYLNAPGICDLAKLGGTELDGLDAEALFSLLERAAEKRLWLVLAGHEVGSGGHQTTRAQVLDRFAAYCADPANGVWIDTVANIAAYVRVNQPPPPSLSSSPLD